VFGVNTPSRREGSRGTPEVNPRAERIGRNC
jgi:hypothetical protein